MNVNDNVPAHAQANGLENADNFFDPAVNYGPLELSLLERVENGLNVTFENDDIEKTAKTPLNEKEKYEGPKEIIFVTGWININSVYQRYMYGFICKILIGLSIIGCILYYKQNFMPIALLLCSINLIHILKNSYFLVKYRNSNTKIKMLFFIELHISVGYFIYFLGFLLFFANYISSKFLVLYSLPYFAFTVYLCFYNDDDNMFLSQKKFLIFEAFQLTLIAQKFSQVGDFGWNYSLILFMGASIYMTVIGLLLTIILSCSLFGFIYRGLEAWKVKSLIWMTWYYLWTGMCYIYLIKGVIRFYNEDSLYERPVINDYSNYQSSTYDIIIGSAIMLMFFSFINLIMHIFWKDEIKKYLAKIIYKDELRKEISVRFLTQQFTFQLIQVSTTYFTKATVNSNKQDMINQNDTIESSCKNEEVTMGIDQLKDIESDKNSSAIDKDIDPCVLCYHDIPNIMIDPCCHGGVCKECMIYYLRDDGAKCPFCKGNIDKLYLLSCDNNKQYYAKAEIKLRA